jgi:hypothetical protein
MSKNSSLSTSTLTPRSLAAPIPTTDVRGHVLKQRGIVTKQIGDSSQPLRHGRANLRHRLQHADGVTRSGEQISNAMTHQAAADNAYFCPPIYACLIRC